MLIKAAIVAGNYPEVSQTFVRRHVEHLFGGNSVLVCCGQTEYELSARPVYAFCDNGFFYTLEKRCHQLINLAFDNPLHGVRGRRYIELRRFLKNYDADCLVVEFGTLAGVVSRAAKALQLPLFIYFRGCDATQSHVGSFIGLWRLFDSLRVVYEACCSVKLLSASAISPIWGVCT